MASHNLEALFEADRALRDAEADFFEQSDKKVVQQLVAAVDEACGMTDREEATMRLERLADLCAQAPTPETLVSMIKIFDDPDPAVRVVLGEALLDVAYDYYAEVARTIEVLLDKGHRGPSMAELPFLLAEVGEPSAIGFMRRFLDHPDAEVVAAAIEASVELDAPELADAIAALQNDTRRVQLDEGFEAETQATLGELAEEAIAALGRDLD